MHELKKFAEKFAAEHGIQDYEINIEGEVSKEENYIGEVIFFNVSPKKGHSFHFIRKRARSSKDSQERTAIKKASEREFYVYSVVFPAMKEFLKKQKKEDFLYIVPKIYHVQEEKDERLMILENMKYSGYQMLDKKFPMNDEHVSLVVQTYAKFHSISFAMKGLEAENFKKITENMKEVWTNFKEVFDVDRYFAPLLRDVLDTLEKNGRSDLLRKFESIEDDLQNIVYVNVEEKDRLVIYHGDAWTNNLLFKNEKGSPESVCLIDFQMCSLSTPVLDLCQFLLSVGNKNVLENIEDYLKLYHQTLTESLKQFGVDANCFSYEKLMEQWRKYCKTGLVIAIFTIQISLAEADETPEDFKELTYSNSSNMKNAEMFNKRMNDLLVVFGEKYL